jgi:hypothetical protein
MDKSEIKLADVPQCRGDNGRAVSFFTLKEISIHIIAKSENAVCHEYLGTMESGDVGMINRHDKVRIMNRTACHMHNYNINIREWHYNLCRGLVLLLERGRTFSPAADRRKAPIDGCLNKKQLDLFSPIANVSLKRN